MDIPESGPERMGSAFWERVPRAEGFRRRFAINRLEGPA